MFVPHICHRRTRTLSRQLLGHKCELQQWRGQGVEKIVNVADATVVGGAGQEGGLTGMQRKQRWVLAEGAGALEG